MTSLTFPIDFRFANAIVLSRQTEIEMSNYIITFADGISVAVAAFNYGEAQEKAIDFMEANEKVVYAISSVQKG